MRRVENPLEHLLARAIRLDSGCLVLPNHADHPTVYAALRVDRQKVYAHRFVYESVHGPTELKILHTCDYPRCFEITHLFAGTQADNMRDMAEKGRHEYPLGEQAWNWQGGVTRDMAVYHREWRKRKKAS